MIKNYYQLKKFNKHLKFLNINLFYDQELLNIEIFF